MNCPKCKAVNKEGAKYCRRCGSGLEVQWQPTWKWNLKTLILIYAVLLVLYFLTKIIL